ncbi:DsrE family protein [Bittarella massiliensis (ex Durand et al. 2017)]|uniref:DsrE family protein n=1 Tax=Bittarella massiliensis (ex Durand et al. 2017) TaxID=1720313 RepID=UPI001AA13BD3|nr:DsrE family protein [Bittarella massiliensis (ex Durand et al. 2017)]MBO1680235.1 hypothetical protein [Bittarella massiliensis (ex Durand et al. 2017)]
MRTIFHVSDLSKWELAIKNAIHMLNYGRDTKTDFTIEFMVNGPAVTPLNLHDEAGEPVRTALQDLVKRGVNVAVSQNTMNHLGLGVKDIPSYALLVPATAIELTRRQDEEYAYIRP